jgi:hypothetical protein
MAPISCSTKWLLIYLQKHLLGGIIVKYGVALTVSSHVKDQPLLFSCLGYSDEIVKGLTVYYLDRNG